jgi:hypothetical protein
MTMFRTHGTAGWFYSSELRQFHDLFEEYDRFLKWSAEFINDCGKTRRCDFNDKKMSDYMFEVRSNFESAWAKKLRRAKEFKEWLDKRALNK